MDSAGQGFDKLGGIAWRLWHAGQLLRQVAALDEFQREERLPGMLADFVDLHDIRVLQPGHGLRLGPEAGEPVRAHPASQDHLQGDDALQSNLPRPEHHAHAAAAEFPQNLVAGYRLRVGECGFLSSNRHRRCGGRGRSGRRVRRSNRVGDGPADRAGSR